MSFLPSVECAKFKLNKAFESGKIIAYTKNLKNPATSTLKLIKTMLKCQVAKASSHECFVIIWLRDFDMYFALFALHRGSREGGMAQYFHPKYAPGCACLNGHRILVTAWNHWTIVFKRCGLLILFFYKKFYL